MIRSANPAILALFFFLNIKRNLKRIAGRNWHFCDPYRRFGLFKDLGGSGMWENTHRARPTTRRTGSKKNLSGIFVWGYLKEDLGSS